MTAVPSRDADPIPLREVIAPFAAIGIEAFTTTRLAGDFGLGDGDPPPAAIARWQALAADISGAAPRFASARQVHGTRVLEHAAGNDGWTRHDNADGHVTFAPGVALGVQIADCVPVFVAHPSGAVALLHAGWRGTAARIVPKAIALMVDRGLSAADLVLHLGPAICGRCYQVGPDVFEQLTGWQTIRERNVDLRALLAEQAKESGVRQLSASPHCTRCDNDRFFSHRAGDKGRQVGVVISAPASSAR